MIYCLARDVFGQCHEWPKRMAIRRVWMRRVWLHEIAKMNRLAFDQFVYLQNKKREQKKVSFFCYCYCYCYRFRSDQNLYSYCLLVFLFSWLQTRLLLEAKGVKCITLLTITCFQFLSLTFFSICCCCFSLLKEAYKSNIDCANFLI